VAYRQQKRRDLEEDMQKNGMEAGNFVVLFLYADLASFIKVALAWACRVGSANAINPAPPPCLGLS